MMKDIDSIMGLFEGKIVTYREFIARDLEHNPRFCWWWNIPLWKLEELQKSILPSFCPERKYEHPFHSHFCPRPCTCSDCQRKYVDKEVKT